MINLFLLKSKNIFTFTNDLNKPSQIWRNIIKKFTCLFYFTIISFLTINTIKGVNHQGVKNTFQIPEET